MFASIYDRTFMGSVIMLIEPRDSAGTLYIFIFWTKAYFLFIILSEIKSYQKRSSFKSKKLSETIFIQYLNDKKTKYFS